MQRDVSVGLLVTLSAVLASCSGDGPPRGERPPPPASGAPAVAHGDHSPRYGGIVWMKGDLHFEVVLAPEGRYRVYFSDAVRAELPAAVVSDVTITIHRPDAEPERLELVIDEYGESWIAEGRSVEDPDANVVVAFTHEGAPYELEYLFGAVPTDVPDPHAETPLPDP